MSRVTLVTGPPCSGKSTYVAEHASPNALVVCWDSIALDMGAPIHPTPRHLRPTLSAAYDRQLALVSEVDEAWVIRCLADPIERAAWAERLGAELVTLCPPRDVLAERAMSRRGPARTMRDVDYWRSLNPGVGC